MHELILNNCYSYRFRNGKGKELVVILSPFTTHSLNKIKLSSSILWVLDKFSNYYLNNPISTVKEISRFCQLNDFKTVLFIGSSKSGFGALLWSDLFKKASGEHVNTICLAFSPQVILYPKNVNINQPSYSKLFEKSESSVVFHDVLKRFGDVSNQTSNVKRQIIYSLNHKSDRVEAEKIISLNTVKCPLPTSFHNTMLPFFLTSRNEDALKAMIRKLLKYKDGQRESEVELITNQVMKMNVLPSLENIIEDELYSWVNSLNSVPPKTGQLAKLSLTTV